MWWSILKRIINDLLDLIYPTNTDLEYRTKALIILHFFIYSCTRSTQWIF